MRAMSDEQWQRFLSEGSRTGKLATVRKDGRPHCVPVWFVLEDGEIVFMTGADSLKARNMARDPRVPLTCDCETFPYDFAAVEGVARIETLSPQALLPISIRIARRYVPADRVEQFARRNAVDGEVLVRVTPTRVFSALGVSD